MKILLAVPLLLALAVPALALSQFAPPYPYPAAPAWRGQPGSAYYGGPVNAVPNLNGAWYLDGDPNKPCEIIQDGPSRRAVFINEQGSRAWGTVGRRHIWVPQWQNGQGQLGTIQSDRMIVFPDGSYWSR